MKISLRKSVLHFIVPLLVVSLSMPINLAARSEGAKINVYKEDGEVIKGRLIEVDVDEGWMVVKPREELAGTRIKVTEIEKVVIKTGVGKHAFKGFLIGAGIGLLLGAINASGEREGFSELSIYFWPPVLGVVGLGLGTLSGLEHKYGKRYYLKGKSPKKLRKILKKLKRKALSSD
jgi:hypothetical protein